jgi:hypothetical protein
MHCFYRSTIILFLLSSLVVDAQIDVSVRKRDFKSEKEGFKEAWDCIANGDSYYKKGGIWYASAYEEYLKAFKYNNSNPELNYKAGVSALYSDNKEKAADLFLIALTAKPDLTDDLLVLTARALQYAGKYTEAIEKYDSYLSSSNTKANENIMRVKRFIEECRSALEITKNPLRIEIVNLGANINSISDDYSEILTPDGKYMYYASRRGLEKSGKPNEDTKFDENILISSADSGSWSIATPPGKNLITGFCETPLYIDSAGNRLFIYAGYANGGDIMMSVKKKGEWKTPVEPPYPINTSGSETSFCLSLSGNEIYFISDNGKDNIGGKDICFIKKISERKWSKPQNIGDKVNTIFDEESVRLSEKGDTLWFSSKGHNSIGGFDIFYSVKNSAGEWDNVKNAGYPVNTPWDELFYYPALGEAHTFYFVSNRSGGMGGLDIYKGKFTAPETVTGTTIPSPEK